ncbi:hypothetical protein ACMBCM_08235, partial [Spiroplasma sp. K1]
MYPEYSCIPYNQCSLYIYIYIYIYNKKLLSWVKKELHSIKMSMQKFLVSLCMVLSTIVFCDGGI